MNIHIGNKFGKILDKFIYLKNYIIFSIKEDIKYTTKNNETIANRMYETVKEFIPSKNDLVIDIGSFDCDYAIIWAKKYKANVVAFEALKENWIKGLKNIAINKLENKIISLNIGLGNSNEIIKVNSNGIMINNFNYGNNIENIYIQKLDNYKYKPFLIKIDIEGFEFQALNGMINTLIKYKPKIIIETHSEKLYNECAYFLQSLNYKLVKIQNVRYANNFGIIKESFWS